LPDSCTDQLLEGNICWRC